MKIDPNINLLNSQKAGNCDSENLVFHINFFLHTQEHVQRIPQKDKQELIQNMLIFFQLNKLKKLKDCHNYFGYHLYS